MVWKTLSTRQEVDVCAAVDLDEFSNEQLLQGLIDGNWISKSEAEAIKKRAATRDLAKIIDLGPDAEELDEARRHLVSGRRDEAKIHLERFLGREWNGVLSS